MSLNNRTFGFKLKLKEDLGGEKKGKECLFLYGLGGKGTIEGVKKLEKETGLKAVALLCNGGGHHTYARFWYDAFPKLRMWICPTKVPNTENGRYLMKNYPDRWELADNTSTKHHVHQLFQYFGQGDDLQVDCVIFNQFFNYTDAFWKDPNQKPDFLTNMDFFKKFLPVNLDKSQNCDDVMFYHKGSKLLITGHHFEFSYVPVGHEGPEELGFIGGFMWTKIMPKMFFSPGRYTTGLPVYDRLRDPAIHAEQWQEVMKWDYEYATGHHEAPGLCGPIDDPEISKDLKGHMKAELEASGELNNDPQPGSWYPWKSANYLYKVVSAEPGFQQKFGPWQEQRFGGPGYGPDGLKKD